MKLSSIFSFLVAVCYGLTIQGCDDGPTELEKLPPETHEGKYTFGCLVNGKAWAPKSSLETYYQLGIFSMNVFLWPGGTRQNMRIDLLGDPQLDVNLTEGTTYPLLAYQASPFGSIAYYSDSALNCKWETSLEHTGTITITHLDQVNWIISGTFEFEAYSGACGSIVKVTHGRFDTHYAP